MKMNDKKGGLNGSQCKDCKFANGKQLEMTHSPGDSPGDAIWCTNPEYLEYAGMEIVDDADLGKGNLVYRIEVIDGPDVTCEWGTPN